MGRSKDIATSAKGDADYVNVSGDTMTGGLTVDAGNGNQLLLDNDGERFTQVSFKNSGSQYAAVWYDNSINVLVNHAASGKGYVVQTGGSTDRLVIDSSGRVTLPSQPSFYAYPSVTSYSTPSNSWFTCAFNTVGWDVGSNYNGSNYRFTAPVAGKYLITWMLQLENSNEPNWIYAYPIVNGSRSVNRSKGKSFSDFKVSPSYHTENGAWIMNLAANDYVTFDMITSGASKDFKGESHWSGILLG